MTITQTDFERAAAVAALVRDWLGYGPDHLSDGAPRSSLIFRDWRPMLGDTQFDRLKPPLRLLAAIVRGYPPGIWRPNDLATKPEDATFAGWLRNRGWAVGPIK